VPARKRKHGKREGSEDPRPGTAASSQGQRDAGIGPADVQPEQPDGPVTGAEMLEHQQKDPELDDSSGTRP
jgi:hypothetical protein